MKCFRLLFIIQLALVLQSCMFQTTSNLKDRDGISSGDIYDTSNVLLQNGCACQNGNSLSPNNECSTFCSNKNNDDQILYFDVQMNPSVFANSDTQNLYDWCTKERVNSSGDLLTNPSCLMEVEDSEGFTTSLDVIINRGSDSLSLDISSLDFSQTYKMVLTQLPTFETSDSIQFIKLHPLDDSNLGSLQISPVNYYECDNYVLDSATQSILFNYRTNYYFTINTPSIIPQGNPFLKCHDGNPNEPDNPSKPRLALDLAQFSVWSLADPRFYDNDDNQKIDLQDIIESKTGLANLPEMFAPYTHATDPINNPEDPTLGFLMVPWLDENTLERYCLTNDDYQSDNIVFRELGNYLGVETEGLYRANVFTPLISIQDSQGVFMEVNLTTFVDVSETMLKKMWFTYDNLGNEVVLTDETVSGKDIFFWWPYDPILESQNPRPDVFTRQQSQTLFKVIDLNNGNASSSHDKRFGCIPKR